MPIPPTARTHLRRALVVLSAVVVVGTAAPGAYAQRSGDDDDRVILTGSCHGGGTWKVKVKTDDGRLEVEGEVDSNVVGQRWRWKLKHNGSLTDRGTARTRGPSGSFEVERRIVDLAGTDRVVFKAKRRGRACRGVVSY